MNKTRKYPSYGTEETIRVVLEASELGWKPGYVPKEIALGGWASGSIVYRWVANQLNNESEVEAFVYWSNSIQMYAIILND